MRFSLLVAVCTAMPGLLMAQGNNFSLLSQTNKYPGAVAPTNRYAGVWGMVVNGKEYALVGTRPGTLIYDCSNPANPVEVGMIPGPTPGGSTGYFWREINSYGSYAYSCSEHGSTQVIDMSNPTSPKLVGTIGSRTHTVSIDQDTGKLFANGGSGRGTLIYDLAANPVNPPKVGSYTSVYVHDSAPFRGYLYTAEIQNGTFSIIDISNVGSLNTISSTKTPGNFTHNVWVTDDDQIAITADENKGGCLGVFDISNKASPKLLATWCSPNGATVHNVFIKGNVAHFSSYTDGYWAIDISDPSNPKAIGGYDTSPLTGNGYNGCWGCYPFQPSGAIYLADMQLGFFIVKPDCGVPNHYGAATAGTNGAPTILHGGGVAKVNNPSFEILAGNVPATASTTLVLGIAPGFTPVAGFNLLVDANWPLILITQSANAQGKASFSTSIPNDPNLANLSLATQVLALDAGAPQGISASRGMTFTICP